MGGFSILNLHAFVLFLCVSKIWCREPKCSAFDYDEKLLEKMIKLEFDVSRSLDEMRTIKEDVKAELETLNEVVGQFKDEMKQFKHRIRENEKENLDELKDVIGVQDAALSRLSEDVSSLRNHTTQLAKVPRVQFRAKDIFDKTPGNGQIIVFKTTVMNEGQGYDSRTGYFTAPVAGTYLLMTKICIVATNYIYMEIMVDNVKQTAFQASGHGYNYCVTWVAISDMDVGSRAYLQSIFDRSGKNVFIEGQRHDNSFSGNPSTSTCLRTFVKGASRIDWENMLNDKDADFKQYFHSKMLFAFIIFCIGIFNNSMYCNCYPYTYTIIVH